jgi:hypothetical protein
MLEIMRHWNAPIVVAISATIAGSLPFGATFGCAGPTLSPVGSDAGAQGDGPQTTTPARDAASPDTGLSAEGGPMATQVDGGIQTKLPPLPSMTNVVAVLNDDSVSISFDPVDGALDYRVYPLPSDGDINVTSDGHVVVKQAIYHCAGDRETPPPIIDSAPMTQGDLVQTQVDQQMVGGYLRTAADATLGYVYTDPGVGLVPVYALGESDPNADNSCIYARWGASRAKKYTTSTAERTQLLAAFARDDGIAFYVPANPSTTTKQVYVDADGVGTKYMARYYMPTGPEADTHPNKVPAFQVLASQAPGSVPLMRVFYLNFCGWAHDELAVGKERFNRAYKQGDTQPFWSLLWPGITGPTTLVVEALDSGCPYQGHFSPKSIASVTGTYVSTPIVHPAYITIDDARAASPTTEAFVNGQHDPTNRPKAIARAFITVAPNPHPKMDFFADFSPNSAPETFTDLGCGSPDGNCFQQWRQQSATFDESFMQIESGPTQGTGLYGAGPVMGELWIAYADWASDTNGKVRITARQKANMDATTFLHVTMEVDACSSGRRYPQILISDRDAPIQYTLDQGHTLIVQPRGAGSQWYDWPIDYQLQICNLRTWDVNNQCPVYDLHDLMDTSGTIVHLAPNDELGELASVDQRVKFDVYASAQRAYLFLDGRPYACANLPSVGVPQGAVTVTWGDVLYHSAVDHTFAFHAAHMQYDTRRHFDNLGFSSGVPAPSWDESRLPCAAPITP